MFNSKSALAISLSGLKTFSSPNPKIEQYPTDSETAADMLWTAFMLGDIEDKTIADFGCGTGILGIGALMLGAKDATFIDIDKNALYTLKRNLDEKSIKDNFKIINSNIKDVSIQTDVVIQNPPFGSKVKHADKEFLNVAFKSADVIYSFHKSETLEFLQKFSKDEGFTITHKWDYKFPLKSSMNFHKSRIKYIDVLCIRYQKNSLDKFI